MGWKGRSAMVGDGRLWSATVGDAKGRRQRRTPVFEEFEDFFRIMKISPTRPSAPSGRADGAAATAADPYFWGQVLA